MTSKERMFWIIAVLILVIAVILAVVLRKKTDGTYFNQLKATYDSSVASIKRERDMYKADVLDLRIDYAALKTADSTEMANLRKSQQLFQQSVNAQLKKIPIHIAAIAGNDDSIGAAFNRFH